MDSSKAYTASRLEKKKNDRPDPPIVFHTKGDENSPLKIPGNGLYVHYIGGVKCVTFTPWIVLCMNQVAAAISVKARNIAFNRFAVT